ncbi:MAG: phosphate ABC transporter permease subunit PstC [Candidatus Omnitrophica bacterium]|nr:phosphate ABC transporter permease subunit PstC [Candidatus Omnitrophota bacterium]MBU4303587.1 phosphate ABC transporter permease subunit PstC [Candidatus Omnitrophota bacterium]MBU4418744.1 phosphate ABC transporter permease subunit PstC [Candidatus Omnitrophota bacterium]MBU4467715.1 phosphate ABC transporter permease subunit PstC [Candidatus Omnitrophota bacterium]
MFGLCLFVFSLVFLMAFGLYQKSKPILAIISLKDLLFSSIWHPTQGHFGLGSFIAGTFWVTAIAVIIAVPLSILTAIYISEYASGRVRSFAKPIIDLLAGISPIIFGVWGIIAVVPLVRDYLMPFFTKRFPFFPFVSDNYTGFSALTGGIVLAVMTFPIIISVVEEVLRTVPFEIREASLALGATKWQTIKYVVLKKARPGIIAAVILGVSRAFGETMAVLMVAGCAMGVFPKSIFDAAYPLPALIANTYGEMMSIPLYDAAVLLAAFILLIVTALFNMVGWGILLHIERKQA